MHSETVEQQDLPNATLAARLFRQACRERGADDPIRAAELPIVAHKHNILSLIESNQVIIVTGETGSGKTTQVRARPYGSITTSLRN